MSIKQTLLNPLKKLVDRALAEKITTPVDLRQTTAEQLTALGHFLIPAAAEPDPGHVILRDGRQKPIAELSEFEIKREAKLQALACEGMDLYLRLADFSARYDVDFDELDEESAPRQAKNSRAAGTQSVSRVLLDGSVKLERKRADVVSYDEDKLMAAKALIDVCVQRFAAGGRSEIKQMAELSFVKNAKGQYSRSGMVRLQQIESDDPEWQQAMELIKKAELVGGVASYKLISVRDKYGKYHPLPLDIAAVRPFRRPADD